MVNNKVYMYEWYDHLICRKNGFDKYIEDAILTHNWDAFYLFALMLNNLYEDSDKNQVIFLPKTVRVYDKETEESELIELTEENFKLISSVTYECG